MNPYESPQEYKRDKYKSPIIDPWGLLFVFIIIIIAPTLFIYIASLLMD